MKQRLINSLRVVLMAVAMVVACGVDASAQRPIVSGALSRDSIEVGDQFDYTIDVEVDRATLWAPP